MDAGPASRRNNGMKDVILRLPPIFAPSSARCCRVTSDRPTWRKYSQGSTSPPRSACSAELAGSADAFAAPIAHRRDRGGGASGGGIALNCRPRGASDKEVRTGISLASAAGWVTLKLRSDAAVPARCPRPDSLRRDLGVHHLELCLNSRW